MATDALITISLLFTVILLAAGYGAFYIWRQGDSNIVLLTEEIGAAELSGANSAASIKRALVFKNLGTQDGVLLDVRVSLPSWSSARMQPSIIRKGAGQTEPDYWVANILRPGESCEGELTLDIAPSAGGSLSIPTDAAITVSYDEVGRSLLVSKEAALRIIV